jgi:hypothetical protein
MPEKIKFIYAFAKKLKGFYVFAMDPNFLYSFRKPAEFDGVVWPIVS